MTIDKTIENARQISSRAVVTNLNGTRCKQPLQIIDARAITKIVDDDMRATQKACAGKYPITDNCRPPLESFLLILTDNLIVWVDVCVNAQGSNVGYRAAHIVKNIVTDKWSVVDNNCVVDMSNADIFSRLVITDEFGNFNCGNDTLVLQYVVACTFKVLNQPRLVEFNYRPFASKFYKKGKSSYKINEWIKIKLSSKPVSVKPEEHGKMNDRPLHTVRGYLRKTTNLGDPINLVYCDGPHGLRWYRWVDSYQRGNANIGIVNHLYESVAV